MEVKNKVVRIFTMPQKFPCGAQSSCCGPIGQTEEEVQALKTAIETELKCRVEAVNVLSGQMKDHLQALRLLRSFGPKSLPIIMLGDDVVSMGIPRPAEAVSAIREKMGVA